MTRGPLTGDELAAVLDPASDILDEVVSARQGEIVRAMAEEIRLHRDAMAPHLLRATRLYTDELGALRKRVAELEAVRPIEVQTIEQRLAAYARLIEERWRALSDGERLTLMGMACRGCGSLDTGCQCWNDE